MGSSTNGQELNDQTINHWMIKAESSGTTPECLWNDACRYFMWCEANPIKYQEVARQTGLPYTVTKPRPFNLSALCLHCGVTIAYMREMAKNRDAGEYHLVVQKILQVIYSQKLEYGLVGVYNAPLVAKDLMLGVSEEGGKLAAVINITVLENGQPKLAKDENSFEFPKSQKLENENRENSK